MDLDVIREFIYNWALVIGAIVVAVIKLPEFVSVVARGVRKFKRFFLKDIYEKVHANHERISALEEGRNAARQAHQTNES